ncbi:hypothetical protein KSP39_PZI003493 [Platanthera zijinensis]|uniref:Bifunctional lysine-specific demethylase and histidyl-hydroxylase n=1 Tax=Platanthera zijinensis TaxID=2320716 RepID=A0AAP0GCJ8_9ASPA
MAESRRRKKVKLGFPPPRFCFDPSSFDKRAFPLMLAAAYSAESKNPSKYSLLKSFIRDHLALFTDPARSPLSHTVLLPCSLLSLLPLFLTSSCSGLAAITAELIGAASLYSLDANFTIVSDEAIVNGLITALVSRIRRVAVAACNTLLDLSVSSIGREKLREFSVIEKLLSLLCQVNESSISYPSLIHREKTVELVLDAALILINTSDEGCFGTMPDELSKKVLPLLKKLWKNSSNLELRRRFDLAAAVFRLSMDHALDVAWEADELSAVIFGDKKSSFQNFMANYWEVSPLLMKGTWSKLGGKNSMFNSLSDCFGNMTDANVLSSLVGKLVSCPPITSDELDIFAFIKEANHLLGSQICYGQDIRVLKTSKIASDSTQEIVGEEVHFFDHTMGSELVDELCVRKLEEALRDGYTIALRGMEFRNNVIAAISEGMSNLFGQPSAGANIYLTPPGSQGLTKHYDDHCVFVWQIFGQKQWRIFPRAEAFLPRLYEPLLAEKSLRQDEAGCMDVLMREGDILYIPRGYPHEAHTIFNMDESCEDSPSRFSMHLTLGIEVEPPFEWEGFTHIALHCWNQKKKPGSAYPIDGEAVKLRCVLVNMLHVAVRSIADKHSVLKRACLVAALPHSSNIKLNHNAHSLAFNLRSSFDYLIKIINDFSQFSETFARIVTTVLENNEDYLLWMRWLRHLPQEEDWKIDYNNPLELFKDLVLSNRIGIEELSLEFSQVKSDFCESVVFEDACDEFMVLLEKYRKTRKQYMKGMLSLHT